MKAERKESKEQFVPVIVTLESQEEVDALFVVCNHSAITRTFPAMNGWWSKLASFRSQHYSVLFDKIDKLLYR